MPQLSVVTITFNNFDELVSTLDSVVSLAVQRVVINGGNCPRTKEMLASFDGVSISEKDRGISDAFNKGLRLAEGEYVVFLNSGDQLTDKDYYADALEYLSHHQDIDFVYADILYEDRFAGPIRIRSGDSLPAMPFLHPTLIARRSLLLRLDGFDESFRIAMDLDLAYRMVKSGAKGHYFPRPVVKMDGKGVSTNFYRTYKENLRVITKNRDFSFRSLIFFIRLSLGMLGKMILLKIGASRLLASYRRIRYSR